MKRLGSYLIAVSLTATLLVSCKKQETGQGPVDRSSGTASATSAMPSPGAVVAAQEYVKKAEAKLGELGERAKTLKDNARKSASSSKRDVEDRIKALDEGLESAKKELNEIRKSDHQADELRARLDKKINGIDKDLSDAVASIR